MSFRRALAVWLCPELAKLPHSGATKLQRKSASQERDGMHLRELDRLLAFYSGQALTEQNAPFYFGPMYEWPSSREDVRVKTIKALIRLRGERQVGVHPTTAFVALNYLSSIWPATVTWPDHIERPYTPKKPKQEAA